MDNTTVRNRLIALREHRKISQTEFAEALGFKDRQTLSAIELGDRKIVADEIVRAAQILGVTVDYFTDPFELAGEGHFSWRQRDTDRQRLDQFEAQAGRWIAAYRYLCQLRQTPVNSSMRRVALHAKSTFEEAQAEGEAIALALQLGDVPSQRLATVIEEQLDTLVLHVDSVAGVSGAACQLGQLNTILVNRNESAARRAFNIAHEFFHLLTWSEMKPRHIEAVNAQDAASPREKRVEQLADNFAAGLLMPRPAIDAILRVTPLPPEDRLQAWITNSATRLGVSGQALKWRMVNLGLIKKIVADRILDEALRADADAPVPRFSQRFVDTIRWGITEGHLSTRRGATLLGMTVDELGGLFTEHKLTPPSNL